jgi:hypothetical protein
VRAEKLDGETVNGPAQVVNRKQCAEPWLVGVANIRSYLGVGGGWRAKTAQNDTVSHKMADIAQGESTARPSSAANPPAGFTVQESGTTAAYLFWESNG